MTSLHRHLTRKSLRFGISLLLGGLFYKNLHFLSAITKASHNNGVVPMGVLVRGGGLDPQNFIELPASTYIFQDFYVLSVLS